MNKAALQVRLLGGFTVLVNDTPIPAEAWRSRRTRNLVKLLALAPNQRLMRDQILDALWPDSDLAAAANNLHQTLFAARKIFDAAGAGGCLPFEDGLLSLSGADVDVDRFEGAAAAVSAAAVSAGAVSAGADRSQDPALFQEALALYAGDLLPEDLYEDWSISRRESLRQARLKLLLELARLYEGRQDYLAGI